MRRFGLMLLAVALVACSSEEARPAQPPAGTTQPTADATAEPATVEAAAPTSAPTAQPQPEPPADAFAAVVDALLAQSQRPHRTIMTIVSEGATTTMETASVPPDRYSATSTSEDGTSQLVIIGDTMWTDNGNGWQSGSAPTAAIQQANTPETIAAALSNVAFVGQEQLNGVPVFVFTYTTSGSAVGAGGLSADVRLWIDAATGLPVQQESTTDIGGGSVTSEQITYDDAITISAP